MKRKTSETPCRIYKYSIRIAREDEAVLLGMIRQATDYYNGHVAIENARRDAYRQARTRIVPSYAEAELQAIALQDETDRLRRAIENERQLARVAVENVDLKAEAKAAHLQSKAAWKHVRELRKLANTDPSLAPEVERINGLANELSNNHRLHFPLEWRTKGRINNAFRDARKAKGSVRRKRFEPYGGVGGQIHKDFSKWITQKGHMTTESVFACESQHFQIEPLPEGSWDTCSKRRHAYTKGRLRIGSQGRSPVWLEFSALLHRPLPETGLIKNAWIMTKRQGNRLRYELQMTIESDDFGKRPKKSEAKRSEAKRAKATAPVAVAVGWRRLPDGSVHVATALDVDDKQSQCLLPADLFRRFEYADCLRSHAKGHFNDVVQTLRSHVESGGDVPQHYEIAAAVPYLAQLRSQKRLARLAFLWSRSVLSEQQLTNLWARWRSERLRHKLDLFCDFDTFADWFDDDDESTVLAAYLELWRQKNRHLYQLETDIHAKARRWREDIFRCWIKQLHGRPMLLAKKRLAGTSSTQAASAEQEDVPTNVRALRVLAAPGRMRELLLEAGGNEVEAKPGKNTAGCDWLIRMCVAVLEAEGYDTSKIMNNIEEQRAVLRHLRNNAAAE